MGKSIYNATLEYANNKLEFWMIDDNGLPINFEGSLTFSISRIDDSAKQYSVAGTYVGNHATFNVNPDIAVLYKDGDDLYSYEEPVFEHIFSVRSESNVYISGKMNLVQIG